VLNRILSKLENLGGNLKQNTSTYLETDYLNQISINIWDEFNEVNDFILNDLRYWLINWYVKINNNYDKLIWINSKFVFFKGIFFKSGGNYHKIHISSLKNLQ